MVNRQASEVGINSSADAAHPVGASVSNKGVRSKLSWKHTSYHVKIGARYRLAAYLGGVVVGALTYIAYHWISAIEFMAAPQIITARIPTYEILEMHPLSFVLWQTASVGTTSALLYLWARMRRLGKIVEQGARIDGLTGVCSHGALQEILGNEVTRTNRYGRPLSVILFDIDGLHDVNENYGHQEGDELIRWFARLLESSVRGLDTVARYGGDEFVLVLPETTSEAAGNVAERIRLAVEREADPSQANDKPRCTVSAGVATISDLTITRQALLLAADVALYHSKAEGKNRVRVYIPEMQKAYRTSPSRLRSMLVHDGFGAIEALSAAVDAKDHNTKGHSDKVMLYSLALGRKLGLLEAELEDLKAAALLHDIGKIGMPDAILKKAGALEKDEWEVVESHTIVGSQILEKVHQLKSIVPGVKHHHERYDGMGYPHGLQGKDIPLHARIISLADAYDAMISDRIYRMAIDGMYALDEIQKCSGTQFDPDLVVIFVQVIIEQFPPDEKAQAA
ncbi:MAG: diguanylate cyclase [Armatimonadota bacterium]|nr:diguanylate cyclase [Armatimonadota bacterium]